MCISRYVFTAELMWAVMQVLPKSPSHPHISHLGLVIFETWTSWPSSEGVLEFRCSFHWGWYPFHFAMRTQAQVLIDPKSLPTSPSHMPSSSDTFSHSSQGKNHSVSTNCTTKSYGLCPQKSQQHSSECSTSKDLITHVWFCRVSVHTGVRLTLVLRPGCRSSELTLQ